MQGGSLIEKASFFFSSLQKLYELCTKQIFESLPWIKNSRYIEIKYKLDMHLAFKEDII